MENSMEMPKLIDSCSQTMNGQLENNQEIDQEFMVS